MMSDLVGAIFAAWLPKRTPYLQQLVDAYRSASTVPASAPARKQPATPASAWQPAEARGPPALDLLHVHVGTNALPAAEARVLEALRGCAHSLHWFHNRSPEWVAANASGETDTSAVVVGTAAADPVTWHRGPGGAATIGFMWIGPHNTSPPHAHAAKEAYHIVAGSCDMSKNGAPFRHCRPGDIVVHCPHDVHCLRTGSSPVLVCWVHSGDLDGGYYFVNNENGQQHARFRDHRHRHPANL